jgi:hypothetical protein
MADRLDEVRMEGLEFRGNSLDRTAVDPAYRAAFRDYGVGGDALDPDRAAAVLADSPIRDRLVAALDDWAVANRSARRPGWENLLGLHDPVIPGRVDPYP